MSLAKIATYLICCAVELLCLVVVNSPACAESFSKLGLYGIYMEPNGDDAEGYSESSAGIGVQLVMSLSRPLDFLGVVVALENTEMGSDERTYYDRQRDIETMVTTTQRYSRFLLGGEIGGHGTGFFRPHAGINLALINYGFSVDRESSPAHESDTLDFVNKYFSRDNKWAFGHDITLGLDLRLSRHIFIDSGVRYLTTYSVPVQLNNAMATVHPEYFQIYLSLGFHGLISEEEQEPDTWSVPPAEGE